MPIFDDIKKEQLALRKQKKAAVNAVELERIENDISTLTTVIGDLQTIEKNGETLDDKRVIQFLKKNIKNLNDSFNLYPESKHDDIRSEIALLDKHLPAQMTPLEIEKALSKADFTDIGGAMKYLTTHYVGRYNGADAKKVILNLLR
jgi:uncharacterized protein YqeY